ncbi:MAG: hypothetical protein ABEJ42_10290 [Halobacteriaceae archaeon]
MTADATGRTTTDGGGPAGPPPRNGSGVAIDVAEARFLARGMQAGIAVCLLAGVLVGNVPVVVNAGLGLGVTLIPAVLERDWGIALGPRLTVLVAAAVTLHTAGMVYFYGATGWWDHLTYTSSSGLVAVAGYATVGAIDAYAEDLHFPPTFLFAFVLVFTLATGVFWEVLEFAARGSASLVGGEPLLDQYGVDDTLLDLVFDAVGAVVVATYGHRDVGDLRSALVGRLARTRRD